jgi:hypothetical protein
MSLGKPRRIHWLVHPARTAIEKGISEIQPRMTAVKFVCVGARAARVTGQQLRQHLRTDALSNYRAAAAHAI